MYDAYYDYRYTKKRLSLKIKQTVLNDKDFTGTEACRYSIIKKIFENQTFDSDCRVLDVGCGTGRILAYLYHHNSRCRLTGIEINPIAFQICSSWARKKNIEVIQDNIFNISISSYDVFILGHPFSKNKFLTFLNKIQDESTQPILLICIIDNDYGNYLTRSAGWQLIQQSQIYKYKGLYLLSKPNRYSIWSFNPEYIWKS